MEKIIGSGFNQPLVPQKQHRLGADNALVPDARRLFVALAKPLHDIRPSARNQFGVLRGEIGFCHHQIHQRQIDGIILGLNDLSGFRSVLCLQTFLLSGGSVFTIEHCPAPERCESVLHSRLSFYGHELKAVPAMCRQFVGLVGNIEKLFPHATFTDTFTDSWTIFPLV